MSAFRADILNAQEEIYTELRDQATALDTLSREELGIDPEELGGSAWVAAGTSFVLFALGAIIPVAPYFFVEGMTAVVASIILSMIGLFVIGAAITVITGRNAKPELIEAADLVTEMKLVKHPFRAGVKGQLGIEF